MNDDVKALVERAKRWAVDTGYDGGPNSVPMQMIAALTAQAEEIERLRGELEINQTYKDVWQRLAVERGGKLSIVRAALKAAQEVKA